MFESCCIVISVFIDLNVVWVILIADSKEYLLNDVLYLKTFVIMLVFSKKLL